MKILTFLLFILSFTGHASLVKKDVSFQIRPETIGKNIQYGVEFFKGEIPREFSELDVERLSEESNTVIIAFKSALIIDTPIQKVDLSKFDNKNFHAQLLNATIEKEYKEEEHNWRMAMKVAVKKIAFDYKAYLLDDNDLLDSPIKIQDYAQASLNLDTNLEAPKYFLIQYMNNFDHGVDKMITLTKIIPYGNKTLVVSYQLTRLYKSFYKKYNFFNAINRVFTNRATSTIENTKRFLEGN